MNTNTKRIGPLGRKKRGTRRPEATVPLYAQIAALRARVAAGETLPPVTEDLVRTAFTRAPQEKGSLGHVYPRSQ
jgi:hypothetical protein